MSSIRIAFSPRTVTTSSWIDGTKGPLFIIVTKGSAASKADRKKIEEINEQFRGELVVHTSVNNKHMFTKETTIQYLNEIVAPAFRQRREQLNLDASHRGLLLWDAFGGTCVYIYIYMYTHRFLF